MRAAGGIRLFYKSYKSYKSYILGVADKRLQRVSVALKTKKKKDPVRFRDPDPFP